MNTNQEIIEVVKAAEAGLRIRRRAFGASDQWETIAGRPTWNFACNEYEVDPVQPVAPGDLTAQEAKQLAYDGVKIQFRAAEDGQDHQWINVCEPVTCCNWLPEYAYRCTPPSPRVEDRSDYANSPPLQVTRPKPEPRVVALHDVVRLVVDAVVALGIAVELTKTLNARAEKEAR